jgi:hypothetical protein
MLPRSLGGSSVSTCERRSTKPARQTTYHQRETWPCSTQHIAALHHVGAPSRPQPAPSGHAGCIQPACDTTAANVFSVSSS